MRRLRYALKLGDADARRLIALSGREVSLEDVAAWRMPAGQPGQAPCPPEMLRALLDGFVRERRGPPPEGASAVTEDTAMNNRVLKSLRIALSLRNDDMDEVFRQGGAALGGAEIGAFLRRPDARNYKRCGDQLLRRFLDGIALRERRRPSPDDS